MNSITELWSKKLYDTFITPSRLERMHVVYDLRCIAYTVAGWATRKLFDAEPICMARIKVGSWPVVNGATREPDSQVCHNG